MTSTSLGRHGVGFGETHRAGAEAVNEHEHQREHDCGRGCDCGWLDGRHGRCRG